MSDLLTVDEALARILSHADLMPCETVSLKDAVGRVLAEDLVAKRTQPPFSASAMDGYAVRAADIAQAPVKLKLIGESAAGHGFRGSVSAGETVRIFTGAPLPEGADTIAIQENVTAEDTGRVVTVEQAEPEGRFVRPAGLDFSEGDIGLKVASLISFGEVSLAASMNFAELHVRKEPQVAIISSGDELVQPGAQLSQDQIISSNSYGVAAIVDAAGGQSHDLGIAQDTLEALAEKIERAKDCDIVVTLGGASVGDHDLVQQALKNAGVELNFWSLAMKPGKPVMFGTLQKGKRTQIYLGLPGNPVSSLVCAIVFVAPLIQKMLGRPTDLPFQQAFFACDMPPSGPRQEYMRACAEKRDGHYHVTPFANQDSSILSNLVKADCLVLRPANAAASARGDACQILLL